MSYQETDVKQSYSGNGSTSVSYVIPFEFDSPSYIKAQVDGVDFAGLIIDDVNRTVTTTTAIPISSEIVFYRDTEAIQPKTLSNGSLPQPEELEDAYNRLTRLVQENRAKIESIPSLTFPREVAAPTGDITLAPSTIVGQDDNGAYKNYTYDELKTLLGVLSLDQTRSLLGITSAGNIAGLVQAVPIPANDPLISVTPPSGYTVTDLFGAPSVERVAGQEAVSVLNWSRDYANNTLEIEMGDNPSTGSSHYLFITYRK